MDMHFGSIKFMRNDAFRGDWGWSQTSEQYLHEDTANNGGVRQMRCNAGHFNKKKKIRFPTVSCLFLLL